METYEDVLAHYGKKGMKWGVRKSDSSGKTGTLSPDAKSALDARVKAKTSGLHSLSNKEVQSIVTRMNLEQSYSRLNPKNNPVKKGQDFVKEGLAVFGTAAAIYTAVNSPLAGAIKASLAKK